MSTVLIFVLLILSFFLIIFKHKKTAAFILICTISLFLLIGTGVIPTFLIQHLQNSLIMNQETQWKEKNAIVLLGGGTVKVPGIHSIQPSMMSYSRIYKTAQLYFNCIDKNVSCKIIISGGDPLHTGDSEANVYRKALLDLQVNHSDIQIEPNSLNTYQNAQYVSAILKKEFFDQTVLVTSSMHAKRALLYFSNFNVHPKAIIADYVLSEESFHKFGYMFILKSGYHFALTDSALHEYVGIARFYIYNFFEFNKKTH